MQPKAQSLSPAYTNLALGEPSGKRTPASSIPSLPRDPYHADSATRNSKRYRVSRDLAVHNFEAFSQKESRGTYNSRAVEIKDINLIRVTVSTILKISKQQLVTKVNLCLVTFIENRIIKLFQFCTFQLCTVEILLV